MQIRIRKASQSERWLTGAEIFWQPVNSRNGRWYPILYRNIKHECAKTRREVLNAVHQGLTVICRAKYNRKTRELTILPPKKARNSEIKRESKPKIAPQPPASPLQRMEQALKRLKALNSHHINLFIINKVNKHVK